MTIEYTANLGLNKPDTAHKPWDVELQAFANLTDEAVAGYLVKAITGDTELTDVDGATSETRHAMLEFTGALAEAAVITVPEKSKVWIMHNNTTGGFPLQITTGAGTVVLLEPSVTAIIFCDGTNCLSVAPDQPVGSSFIINGDLQIAEDGTTFSAVGTGKYTLDQFGWLFAGSGIHEISRDSDVPTQIEANDTAAYSLKIECTGADAVIASGAFYAVEQPIEGYRVISLLNRIIAIGFWAAETVAGIYCIAFQNSGKNRSYVAEYTITSANIWQFVEIIIPMDDGLTGTWDFTNGTGLRIYWTKAAGATYQTTPNTWQTGEFYGTANQVNAVETVGNISRMALIKGEVGTRSTRFQHKTFTEYLAEAQWYFWQINGGVNIEIGLVTAISSTQARVVLRVLRMRASATEILSANDTFRITFRGIAYNLVPADTISTSHVNSAQTLFINNLFAVVPGGPWNIGDAGEFKGQTNFTIKLDARLTL